MVKIFLFKIKIGGSLPCSNKLINLKLSYILYKAMILFSQSINYWIMFMIFSWK